MLTSTTAPATGSRLYPSPIPKTHIPLFKIHAQKEIPEKLRPANPRFAAKRAPLVIDAAQVKQLQQKLDRNPMSASEKSRKERELLKKLSQERAQNWEDTFINQRKNRLQDRQRRLEQEEQDRCRVDQEHDVQVQKRREEFIRRAKELVFYENDNVKNVHSQVLLDTVLQERELQILHKKKRAEMVAASRDDWKKHSDAAWDAREAAEEKAKTEREQKRMDLDAQQRKQHQERAQRVAAEQQSRQEEGRRIRQQDEAYNLQAQQQRAANKEAEHQKQRALLDSMVERKKKEKEMTALETQQKDAKIQEWFDLKMTLEEKRQEAEEAILKEKVRIREKIGRDQFSWLEAERNKKNAWIDMRMQQKQKEEQRKDDMAAAHKHQTAKEMQSFFEEMQKRKAKAKEDKEAFNKRVAEDNVKARAEIAADIVARHNALREKELKLNASHKVQIADVEAKRVGAKRQVILDLEASKKQDKEEKDTLRLYIDSLMAEPWLRDNPCKHKAEEYHKKAFEQNIFAVNSFPKIPKKPAKKSAD